MGDVRGLGMLIGVELVRDRDTKEPISAAEGELMYRELINRGVMVASAGQVIRITPPLVLTQELADRGLDIFEEAITAFEEKARIG
jgi:4-aminobutyrate aminotransferase-like enzyme